MVTFTWSVPEMVTGTTIGVFTTRDALIRSYDGDGFEVARSRSGVTKCFNFERFLGLFATQSVQI